MYVEKIVIGVRQIERWSIASRQDLDPGVKMMHANYAVGNLDMLRQMFADDEIFRVTGKHPIEMHKAITALQDEAAAEAIGACPTTSA